MLLKDLDPTARIFNSDAYRTARDFMKETGWKLLASFCFMNLLLTAFSLSTLFSFVFFGVSVAMLLRLKWKQIREAGLIQFLPESASTLLLKRSFFDVLCDLWFYPRIGLILKAVLTPFFIEINPENAVQQLDVLDENDKKLFLTKGVVYVLPRWLKHLILPKSYKIQKKIHEFMDSDDDPALAKDDDAHYETGSFLSVKEKVDMLKVPKKMTVEKFTAKVPPRNRIILSSQMLKSISHFPGKLTEQWDNLQKYREEANIKRRSLVRSLSEEDLIPELNRSGSQNGSNQPKGSQLSAINMVMNIIELKKQKLLKKFSQKFLVFLFVVCVSVFAMNLGVSKRYRKITKNILLGASYMGILSMSLFSFSAIIMKARADRIPLGANRE